MRGATRVFRLSRVAGPVRAVGRPGDVEVPVGIDLRAQVTSLVPQRASAEAKVCARPASGLRLRRRATATRPGAGSGGWDELTVPYGDLEVLAEEIAGFGADVIAVAPRELRDAVVRRLRGVLETAAEVGPDVVEVAP